MSQFGSRSGPILLGYGSKLFAKVISRQQLFSLEGSGIGLSYKIGFE